MGEELVSIIRDFELRNNKEMEKIKINYAQMHEAIKNICDKTERIESKMDTFINSADERFAPMWVASALKWFAIVTGGTAIGILVTSILSLIIK